MENPFKGMIQVEVGLQVLMSMVAVRTWARLRHLHKSLLKAIARMDGYCSARVCLPKFKALFPWDKIVIFVAIICGYHKPPKTGNDPSNNVNFEAFKSCFYWKKNVTFVAISHGYPNSRTGKDTQITRIFRPYNTVFIGKKQKENYL